MGGLFDAPTGLWDLEDVPSDVRVACLIRVACLFTLVAHPYRSGGGGVPCGTACTACKAAGAEWAIKQCHWPPWVARWVSTEGVSLWGVRSRRAASAKSRRSTHGMCVTVCSAAPYGLSSWQEQPQFIQPSAPHITVYMPLLSQSSVCARTARIGAL